MNACSTVSMPTLNTRPLPASGALAWLMRLNRVRLSRRLSQSVATGAVDEIHTSPYSKDSPLVASLSVNQKITGRNSEKDVRHIEIDLGDSGLRYQPGDALGVWYQNDPALVKELVELLWLKGDEPVTVEGKTLPLNEAYVALRTDRQHRQHC